MNRRSGRALRTRSVLTGNKRKAKKGNEDPEAKREYERNKKRKQREKGREEGLKKRGPKVKIDIKHMTQEEKKEYERIRKKEYRMAKKLKETEDHGEEKNEIDEREEIEDRRDNVEEWEEIDRRDEIEEREGNEKTDMNEEIDEKDDEELVEMSDDTDGEDENNYDFTINDCATTAKAILNLIPRKVNFNKRYTMDECKKILSKYTADEQLDIMISVAHFLRDDVKELVKQHGVDIVSQSRKVKRTDFSSIAKSTKFRAKDSVLKFLRKGKAEISADTFFHLFQSVASQWATKRELLSKTCGIHTEDRAIPPRERVKAELSLLDASSISSLNSPNKVVKIGVMEKILDVVDVAEYGAKTAVADTMKIAFKSAKRLTLASGEGKNKVEMAKKKKKKDIGDTEWPQQIKEFCLTKPVCRECPGESVSIGYGERAEKFIRQFSISEIYELFVMKFPDFPYKLSTFRSLVPKNLVQPSLRDVKQNTCPLHENVKRSVKALNRFFKKNKAKNLLLPTSTIDLCLQIICLPFSQHPDNAKANRDPLNWSPKCTKGLCANCGGNEWFENLKKESSHLSDQIITYTQWIKENEDGKSKQILRQEKCCLSSFLETVFRPALIELKNKKAKKYNAFPEHLRKAWAQWQLTKHPLRVSGDSETVAVRTREDFQEDIKFLCTSETVSTHRGIGVITMVCYPVVLEVFKADGTKEMYGFIILSNTKCKGFDTVKYFEEKCLTEVRSIGYNIVRYDRISDGCSSQFWCYGTFHHLQHMPDNLGISLINFHRYERYEGKNLSDALGSLLKRKMRGGALQNRVFGNKKEYMERMLDEIDDDTDLDEIAFNSQDEAFLWLKAAMNKGDSGEFSKSFRKIELMWIGKEEIPSNLVKESEVHKIPQVKSYNTATAIAGIPGVMLRDNSCVCGQCLSGQVLKCTTEKNGTYFSWNMVKMKPAAGKRKQTAKVYLFIHPLLHSKHCCVKLYIIIYITLHCITCII